MRCNTRTNWEFYAVIDGRCGLRFTDRQRPALREKTLWVFAPECSHAWASPRGTDYERISMHFASVPYPLDDVVRANGGWLERRIDATEIARLRTIAAELEPAFCRPTALSPLVCQRHLLELALLLLGNRNFAELPPALTDLANFKIERAVSWYAEHLSRNPTVKEVADAMHVSPSHLRRLFWRTRRSSPKSVFRRLRLEKAKELMSHSALTLDDVARHCGYSNASHLCRDCRAMQHFSPTTWRKKLIDRFVQPVPPGFTPMREFSARAEERTMPA